MQLSALAQSESKVYQDATEFMQNGQYDLAVEAFAYIQHLPEVQYKATICSLLSKHHRRIPISRLQAFETSEDDLYLYWLGKVYLTRFKFDEARHTLQLFQDTFGHKSKYESYSDETRTLLNYLSWKNEEIEILPVENPINGRSDDIGAIVYENGSQMIYISDRETDQEFSIYQTQKTENSWDTPQVLLDISLDKDAFSHVLHRDEIISLRQGSIYSVSLADLDQTNFEPIESPDLSKARHFYINKYKTRIIFSMENGDNGVDIFESLKLRSTGEWMQPVSISKNINSTHDEDYPFLSVDGKTLYFSSNRTGGLGQFDIYLVHFDDETNSWGQPVNAGLPVNSPDDDIDFKLFNELEGAFASDRVYSSGGLDIFQVKFSEKAPAPLLTGH